MNYCKNGSIYRFDIETTHVSGFYGTWSQKYTTVITGPLQNKHISTIFWHRAKVYVMYQATMMAYDGRSLYTQHEQNPLIPSLIYMYHYKHTK